MSVFPLLTELHERKADLSAMMDGWMELSKKKGWPLTGEGLRRYLARAIETEQFPTIAKQKERPKADEPPPDFVKWWRAHDHCSLLQDGSESPRASIAWRCQRYRHAWMDGREAVS